MHVSETRGLSNIIIMIKFLVHIPDLFITIRFCVAQNVAHHK